MGNIALNQQPADRAEAAIGSYLKNADRFELSVGLVPAAAREGLCIQRRCFRPDKPNGGQPKFLAISVAANHGPAGMKPAETFLVTSLLETSRESEQKLRKLKMPQDQTFNTPG